MGAIVLLPASARAHAACENVVAPHGETVLVLRPPSDFTICRDGHEQADVVAGRRVFLELQPTADGAMFEFRLRGQKSEPGPSGLAAWEELAANAAGVLHDLAESSEPIAEQRPVMSDAARRPLAAARELYLGMVTPEFHGAAREAATESAELPAIAATLARWCKRYQGRASPLADELHTRCAASAFSDGATIKVVAALRSALDDFHARRAKARELLVQADAVPNDPLAQDAAVRALAEARASAAAVVERARSLQPLARELARAAAALREAVQANGELEPGHPVFLARYPRAGQVVLELEVRPVGILAAGAATAKSDTSVLTFRFSVVDTHYIDLEVGLGITGGVPPVPTLSTTNGMAVIQGKAVDE
ncbi:MAG TPA: hypothetical protein VFF06_22420, partial [Polyangia bacterium]|nr:hypothetical protein [Polyangia bacterium]